MEGRSNKSKASVPVFEVRRESFDDMASTKKKSHDVPEVDTMDNVVNRMIGNSGNKRLSFSQNNHTVLRRSTKNGRDAGGPQMVVGPKDPADIFYSDETDQQEQDSDIVVRDDNHAGGKRRRWSKPINKLRDLSTEGLRNILYSSK
jgi:hypothetical protein